MLHLKLEINENTRNAIYAIAVAIGFIAYFWCMTNITVITPQ